MTKPIITFDGRGGSGRISLNSILREQADLDAANLAAQSECCRIAAIQEAEAADDDLDRDDDYAAAAEYRESEDD